MVEGVHLDAIAPGTPVVAVGGEGLGAVEAITAGGLRVAGRAVPRAAIAGGDAAGVRLALTPVAFAALPEAERALPGRAGEAGDERLVVPVVEERLVVGARATDLGEIAIRKRIVEEERMVRVVVRREEVEVLRRGPGDPPIPEPTEPGVQLIRIPLHGEAPLLSTEAVVTREIVVSKEVIAAERHLGDTVRREHVAVTEHYRAGSAAARNRGRTVEEAEADLRREQTKRGGGDDWARLREELRAGYIDACAG